MKKLALLLPFLLAAGVAVAQEKKAEAPKAPAATSNVHDVNAEFVSADLTKKTLTIKLESGEQSTAPLEGKAVEEAKNIKAGQKVVVSCKDDAYGKHVAAVAVKAAPAAPEKK